MKEENINAILSMENFSAAWRKIRARNSQYGIDKVTIEEFSKNFSEHVYDIIRQVTHGEYIPQPYKLIFIKKEKKEFRPISLLTLKDKLLQTVVSTFYYYYLNKFFVNTNYAYRPNKGHVKAVKRVRDFIARKYYFFCHLDIDNFFDSIDRLLLIEKVKYYVKNDIILNLFRMWVQTGAVYNYKYIDKGVGIAQGGVVSPLLSNIYMNSFDHELQNRNIVNVRYSDNILLLSKNEKDLKTHFSFVKEYLEKELKLRINKDYRFSDYDEGFEFLGILFKENMLTIAPGKYKKIKRKFFEKIMRTEFSQIPFVLRDSIEGIRRYYYQFDTDEQLTRLSRSIIEALAAKSSSLEGKISLNEAIRVIKNLNLARIVPTKSNNYFVNLYKDFFRTEKEKELNKSLRLRRKIEINSRKYVKVWYENLDMIVSTSYSSIGKRGDGIVVRNKGYIQNEVSVSKIRHMIISAKGVTITTDAIRLLAEHKIRIDYLDPLGKPYAALIPASVGVSPQVIAQVKALKEPKAKIIVRNLILAKIKNQLGVLKFFKKNRKELRENEIWEKEENFMEEIIDKVEEIPLEGNLNTFRDKILGLEGSFASAYWRLFALLLPEHYGFESREHKNARNPINIMLNYGYGILYTRVHTSVILSGLNPQVGFLHRQAHNKPSLVFDLVEPFRAAAVDRTVLAFVSKRKNLKITQQNFSATVKSELAKKILGRLSANFYYRNKVINLNQLIINISNDLKNFITGESKKFKPFLLKW
jgi:group II intron reverse transcriptase/maturase/CRISPR-associated endonuclease Cas1